MITNPFARLTMAAGLLLVSLFSHAFKLSGMVEGEGATHKVAYANIDLYSGTERIASTLTDDQGVFSLELNGGTYRLEIHRFGYHSKEMSLKLVSDTSLALRLTPKEMELGGVVVTEADTEEEVYSRGPKRDLAAVAVSESRYMDKMEMAYRPAMDEDVAWESPQAEAGLLTAGEVNDFSKWEQWTDLDTGELRQHREFWTFFVQQRYMVQVMDQSGLPLADARVELLDRNAIRIFSARTDNTGKAELWAQLGLAGDRKADRILVQYSGQQEVLRNIHVFGSGDNRVRFRVDCNQSQQVDISFVVDATGSMADELEFLKKELNDVIFKSTQMSQQLDLRYGHVFYRDKGDEYLTRHMDFTRVLSEATEFIRNQFAAGGGDAPEAVDAALEVAINQLSWSEHARARLLFLVLDAPPHGDDSIKQRMISLARQAAAKGIRIIPVSGSGIDKSTEYLMRSLALTTNGTYAFLTNHSGIGGDHIEPSTDEYEVETLNQLLVRLMQSFTYMPDCQQEMPEMDLPYSDSLVVVPDTTAVLPPDGSVSDSTDVDQGNGPVISWNWKFYPNPTRGPFTITADHAIGELHITDLSGKLLMILKDIRENELRQVDLSGYPSGIYLLRYPHKDRLISGKLVLYR